MNFNRRNVLRGMAALAAPIPSFAMAQNAVLPLNTPGLDHLDVMVIELLVAHF
jgi:hypothetical protein